MSDHYLLLKFLHIISSVIIIGTGAGIAFFMLTAYLSKNINAITVTAKNVILGDWLFTAPAICLQVVTGFLLMQELEYSFVSPWFLTVVGLYAVIFLAWVPVLFIQYKLFSLAKISLKNKSLTKKFHRLIQFWVGLGILAFFSIIIILYLMVFKPFSIM